MATSDDCSLSPVEFVRTCAKNFYFQKKTTTDADVDEDSFTKTDRLFSYMVRNKKNKILSLCEKEFEAANLSDSPPESKFKIQTYKDIPGGREGIAAMLYVTIEEKNYVACCSASDGIYPEEMTPPSTIAEETHRAVFYMSKVQESNAYVFESSMYSSKLLAFKDTDDPSVQQLVLCLKDKVKESAEVHLTNKSLSH